MLIVDQLILTVSFLVEDLGKIVSCPLSNISLNVNAIGIDGDPLLEMPILRHSTASFA